MKIELHIPDELYDVYDGYAGARDIDDVLLEQLERFQGAHPQDRSLLISPRIREQLEKLLPMHPGPHLYDDVDLLERVKVLASISIGNVRLDFTPAQYEALKNYSDRQGRTLEELVQSTVLRMQELFFDNITEPLVRIPDPQKEKPVKPIPPTEPVGAAR